MKKIVWVFGFISGAILIAVLLITAPLYNAGILNFDNGEWFGYTTMVLAMSMVFFGVKSYRDNHLNGAIKFGNALKVGLLIASISSAMYVLGWEVDQYFFATDFIEKYASELIAHAEKEHATPEKMAKLMVDVEEIKTAYHNPFLRMGMTLMEVLPVGILVSLVTAALLRRKEILIV